MNKAGWSALAGASVLMVFLTGCGGEGARGENAAEERPSLRVRAVEAMARPAIERIELSGTIEAESRAVLRAKLMAHVERVEAEVGQAVSSGETLVQLAADEVMAKLAQARSDHRLSQIELERLARLRESSAATEQEMDRARLRAEAGAAALEVAQAQADYLAIVAPFEGVVARRMVEVGDTVVPGSALVEIHDPRQLRAVVAVPESLAGKIEQGSVWDGALEGRSEAVKLTAIEIAPLADARTRSLRVEFALTDSGKAYPGMRASVFIPVEGAGKIWIPEAAVFEKGQLEYVFAISAEGRALLRLVKVGERVGGYAAIQSGLNNGERVVASDTAVLGDGQHVEVEE